MAPAIALFPDLPPSSARGELPSHDGPTGIEQALAGSFGLVVLRSLVDPDVVERALRRLNLEIVRTGLTPEEVTRCSHSTFFPHLRWEREVLDLRKPVERVIVPRTGDHWADAQLLIRFPDEADDWPLSGHVDALPPWAGNRSYRAIAGVALSPSTAADGCLAVWPGSHLGNEGEPALVELQAGDVVVMHPALLHSSTLNRGGRIRYAVYFRLLAAG